MLYTSILCVRIHFSDGKSKRTLLSLLSIDRSIIESKYEYKKKKRKKNKQRTRKTTSYRDEQIRASTVNNRRLRRKTNEEI